MDELPPEIAKKLLYLKRVICECFTESNWRELGLLAQCTTVIDGHPRLLQSLYFRDDDYESCVIEVLENIARLGRKKLEITENYVTSVAEDVPSLADVPSALNRYFCAPAVFKIPAGGINSKLVALMMPFDAKFNAVCSAIKEVAEGLELSCKRADDIWEDSTIIQDVFALIYRSAIVVCDFSDRNANVFYEAGVAHVLGRKVIPLAQHESDIPFDLRHHRYLMYLPNEQGLEELKVKLAEKLRQEMRRGGERWVR